MNTAIIEVTDDFNDMNGENHVLTEQVMINYDAGKVVSYQMLHSGYFPNWITFDLVQHEFEKQILNVN